MVLILLFKILKYAHFKNEYMQTILVLLIAWTSYQRNNIVYIIKTKKIPKSFWEKREFTLSITLFCFSVSCPKIQYLFFALYHDSSLFYICQNLKTLKM